ncbi:bifunctional glycosyltransferase/CDP-glycerol:glycerophosphate glycerophosphotransferase [Streptomyces sp. BE133]|uniref:bifunctional glycosyltransferase/CDP-glycerol:glycerophosphate glycerophosphotransferase n=1 Tax=Streptomyces sp. BE133 TaxID=3002523 RepID=UPI002E796220|nr:bifunctional glycosyltransferase family 2 protein/CDP-glycerol:glycerophosphate glycerophosphotransferase [Streptomyces sp. BE133]MEE1809985.1 bifunctional glycosyltransferase family 2 protein/CDP-glycerol:glycerophosphate glycerophosphotransferase [Streptomyces sp. BE133]
MLLSVVVPVHRVQGYLRASLESVLGQGPGEPELLVVDDGSRDGSAEIAAEFAARDPRVRVITLAEHRGAGPARNAGAAEARGRFLLFLDGDDLLRPGALEAITGRLAESEPDVLLLGHDRIDWWGDVSSAAPVIPSPASVAEGFSTAVPRLFRRAFWTAHGLHFTDGPYEDVLPVHRATLLASGAGTLDTLDRICVRHRIRRSGTFATTPGRHHFAILDAYERLLAETDHDPRIRAARTHHLRAVVADPGRIAPEDRAAFHRAAALPGNYAAHRAREAARTGRTRTLAALRHRKKTLRARVMRAAYRADLLRPLDPDLAVYGAYWNRGVACNPAAIHAKALELAPHIRGVWVVSSRHRDRMPPGIPYVIEGSRAYWRAMATATYLINNSSFPGGFTKRPGQRYLQTHHGTPLKTMGLDQRVYPALTNGISFEKIVAHADQWDFSLSANPHTTEIWDRVYPSGYEHLNLGYPRNDIFFTATPEQTAAIRQRLSLAPDRTVLLYAPTHRDYRKGFVPHLDLERLARELGPDYVVLVRAHYFYGRSTQLDGARVVDVTAYPSVEELCLVSDALITDYSSLMFDYACLDRPIISHAPDWAAYRASRGTYFDLLSGRPGDTPGAVATDEDELLEVFRTGEWCSARTAELRAAFRERFCPYDDGHAAERVVRRLFLSDRE